MFLSTFIEHLFALLFNNDCLTLADSSDDEDSQGTVGISYNTDGVWIIYYNVWEVFILI